MILNDISYVQVVPVDLYFSFAQTYFIICIGLMVMILYPRNSQYTGIELSTGAVFEICHFGEKCCGGLQGILNFDAIKGIPNVEIL